MSTATRGCSLTNGVTSLQRLRVSCPLLLSKQLLELNDSISGGLSSFSHAIRAECGRSAGPNSLPLLLVCLQTFLANFQGSIAELVETTEDILSPINSEQLLLSQWVEKQQQGQKYRDAGKDKEDSVDVSLSSAARIATSPCLRECGVPVDSRQGSKRGVLFRSNSRLEEVQKQKDTVVKNNDINMSSNKNCSYNKTNHHPQADLVLIREGQEAILDGKRMPLSEAVASLQKRKDTRFDVEESCDEKNGVQRTLTGYISLSFSSVASDVITRDNTFRNQAAKKVEEVAYSDKVVDNEELNDRDKGESDGDDATSITLFASRRLKRRGSSVEFGECEDINDSEADKEFDTAERRNRRGSLIRHRLPTGYVKLSKEQLEQLAADYEAGTATYVTSNDASPFDGDASCTTPTTLQSGHLNKEGIFVKVSSMRAEEIGDLKSDGGVEVFHSHNVSSCDVSPTSDSFWDISRVKQRHKKVASRRPTGKFSYDLLSIEKLHLLRAEALELEEDGLAEEMEHIIKTKREKNNCVVVAAEGAGGGYSTTTTGGTDDY